MQQLLFYFNICLGTIVPMNDDHEGREMYNLRLPDNSVIEYCYKEEILEYLETGTFEYNEYQP